MRNILTSLLLVFLGLLQANAFSLKAPDDDFAIHGIVKDEITRRPIAYVNVYLVGSEIGTVTNEDGVFSLKLKDSDAGRKLEISCMGYASGRVEVPDKANASKGLTVFLKPVSHLLNEAKIFGGDAKAIVLEALGLVRENYPLQQNLLTMFYRETITKGSRYAGISEGMMEVNKRSYARRNVRGDKVRILKGRKLLSQKTGDTLAVKIQGGPHLAVDFDFVKNADMLFDEQSVDYYIYEYDSFIMLDDRIQYVIKFKPCVTVDYPLYTGLLYIDAGTLSFTRAEISLDMSDREKADKTLLRRKPAGLKFRALEANFTISYRFRGDKACLDYIKSTLRFRCDWKKRLFYSSYTASSEMVVVDLDATSQTNIPYQEAFSESQVFDDCAVNDWDKDYWKDFNIIEPTESLEKAAAKLSKLYKKR